MTTKTPEQYFVESVELPPESAPSGAISDTEKAFLDKYLGVNQQNLLGSMKRIDPTGDPVMPGLGTPPPAGDRPHPSDGYDMTAELEKGNELQLVSFFLGRQEFALPIMLIQEVIRSVPSTKVPRAPKYMAGVINLRGKVTPLMHLNRMIQAQDGDAMEEKFTVICRHKGLQIGLMIHSVATMYRTSAKDMEFNVDAQMGAGEEFVTALFKKNDGTLIGILSLDRITQAVL